MIDAIRAFEKTKYNFEINLVKDNIENGINNAIERGEYTCKITIKADTKQFVRDEITKWLIGLGYRCTIPKYESQDGCPSDQMNYWNEIDISWKSEKMINEERYSKKNV